MAAVDRVYKVEDDETISMVIATSQAQALNHVVKGKFKVSTATALDVAEYMGLGGTIDRATKADEVPGAPADPVEE